MSDLTDRLHAHALGVVFDGLPTATGAENTAQNIDINRLIADNNFVHRANAGLGQQTEKLSCRIAEEMDIARYWRVKSHTRGKVIGYLCLALAILVPFAYAVGRMAR